MLNNTQSLIKIKQLLDDFSVYKYTDDGTAEAQIEADLITISEEVYLNEMIKIISPSAYETIQATPFTDYTANWKRLFYAECYFIASKFLQLFALRYETDMYKSTLDLNSRTIGVEKSGKLYTADEYLRTARANVTEYQHEYNSIISLDNKRSFRINRY